MKKWHPGFGPWQKGLLIVDENQPLACNSIN
jgi:hypothetical protein